MAPKATSGPQVCPLIEGGRYTMDEYLAAYAASEADQRWELLDGIARMTPPIGFEHRAAHGNAMSVLGLYAAKTRGLMALDAGTTKLGARQAPEPDCALCIEEAAGGGARVVNGVLHGPPELLVEVSDTTLARDLGEKLRIYREAGVIECLVVNLQDRELRWFRLGENRELVTTDGILRSVVFPGLRIDAGALLKRDAARLIEVLEHGLKTPEHASFAQALARRLEGRAQL